MANDKTKEVAGKAADILLDILKNITGASTDVARNIVHAIIDKPWVGGLMAKLGSSGASWIKAGGLTKFIADFAAAKQAGAGLKVAFKTALGKQGVGVSVRGFTQAGKVGKAGTIIRGAASIVGIIAAIQIAKKTVDAAAAQFDNKWEKFKTKPNVKTGWELFWETSIPVATYRWIESAVKQGTIHATPETKKPVEETKEQKNESKVSFTGEANKISGYTGFNYDEAAKQLGMSTRPSNPTAENEWKKEVERNMKKNQKNTSNAPKWYFQGLANKLLGTTLTWTGLKDHTSGYSFVSAVGLHYDMLIPTDAEQKLHNQIIANTNIEWQALRGKNTGAFQYTEKDVFTYDFTLMSLISCYRFVAKLISLTNKYDPEVERLPQHLLAAYYNQLVGNTNTGEAMYSDIVNNKPLYITRLNSIGKQINSYALKGRTLISRWNYLADKCLKDYSGEKAIYAYYCPRYVVSLDGTDGIKEILMSTKTIPEWLTYLEGQCDLLRTFNNGALLKVAGDMIKLLGATKDTFDNVPYVTGEEKYAFDYDPEAFDQIRNAKVMPIVTQTTPDYDRLNQRQSTFDIKCSSGSAAITDANFNLLGSEYLITSDRKKEFSHEENIQMIQFWATFVKTSTTVAGGFQVGMTECGTSLLDHVSVVTYTSTGSPAVFNYCGIISVYNGTDAKEVLPLTVISTLPGSAPYRYEEWRSAVAQIDFMPRYQLAVASANESKFLNIVLDVDNYAYMTNKQYSQLNNVAVYSQTFVFNPEDVKIIGLLS